MAKQAATGYASFSPFGQPISFLDPMTARQLGTSLLPTDKIVDLSVKDKLEIGLHQWFVDIPKAIKNGLQGNSDFTMSDLGKLAQVPYYLGGAFLTLGYMAGKHAPTAWQQGLGVLGYYGAFTAAQAGVNALYKILYGVDLGLMYKTPKGKYDKVFGSVSFPRIELLRKEDYMAMRKKMGIPDDVASPNEAVKHQLPNILSSAAFDCMVLGNALAAITAGYLTRVASVKGLLQGIKALGQALKQPQALAGLTGLALLRQALPKLHGTPGTGKLAASIGLGTPLAVVGHALHAKTPEHYEASGIQFPTSPKLVKHPSPHFAPFTEGVQ
jgi:hypothetical protein